MPPTPLCLRLSKVLRLHLWLPLCLHPRKKRVNKKKRDSNIMMALDMLQSAVGAFAPDTEEGQTIEKVVTEITRRFW
jgi:hypothetical protein